MSKHNFTIDAYASKRLDSNLLSALNVNSVGDVITAEAWTQLWELVISTVNSMDDTLQRVFNQEGGVLVQVINDYERIVEDHNVIKADHQVLKARFDNVLADFETFEKAYKTFTAIYADIKLRHEALETNFIHYGETPPTNPYIKLWVAPTQVVSEPSVGEPTGFGGEIFNDYENNQATGLNSTASGSHTIAAADSQYVVGEYNQADLNAQFIVGNGTDAGNRNNAFVVRKDNSIITCGLGSTVSGTNHEVHGSMNNVSGSDNAVFGYFNNITNGLGNEVFGNNNTIEEGVSFSIVNGFDNIVKAGATKVAVRGQDITVGVGNPADSEGINFFDGARHKIGDGYGAGNVITGRSNKTEGFVKSLHMGGQRNTAISNDNYDFNATYINGYKNTVTNSKYALVTGDTNDLKNGQSTFLHGARNFVDGSANMVMSSDTYVTGTGNRVVCRTSAVVGNSNTLIGNWLKAGTSDAPVECKTVLGIYNDPNDMEDTVLVVGAGVDDNHRINGFKVLSDGSATVAKAGRNPDGVVRYDQFVQKLYEEFDSLIGVGSATDAATSDKRFFVVID